MLALGCMAQGVTLTSSLFEQEYDDDESFYIYSGSNELELKSTLTLKGECEYSWHLSGDGTLSGSGKITSSGSQYTAWFPIYANGENCTLGSGISFNYVSLGLLYGTYTVKSTFTKTDIECSGCTADFRSAEFSGKNALIIDGATVILPTLEVSTGNMSLDIYYASKATLQGDLVLAGGSYPKSGNWDKSVTKWDQWFNGGVKFIPANDSEGIAGLTVTGSITVNSDTPIIFMNEDVTGKYYIPDSDTVVFSCSALNDEASLYKLKPYGVLSEYCQDEYGYYESYTDIKYLGSEYMFEARTGEDGLVYIYLVEGETASSGGSSSGSSSEFTGMTVSSGQTVTLTEAPAGGVLMAGGTADLTRAAAGVLSSNVIGGNSGTVITNAAQEFNLTGSRTIGYSITGADGATGAALNVGTTGGTASIRLNGTTYNTALTTVGSGTLTVGSKATLGNSEGSILKLTGGSSNVTNFGTIIADTQMGSGSTLLNSGVLEGNVSMSSGAILTNNGTANGDVIIPDGAEVYGSGLFNARTVTESGGLLYAGNSPGYQKHNNLTLQNGARMGFYIDGTTPATLSSAGSGCHSFVSVSGPLTLEGTVNAEIGIGMGLLYNGVESFTLTLMQVEDVSQLTETEGAGFTYTITEGEMLLEEGSTELKWENGELTFSATVSEEALMLLTGSAYADTLWASAGAVKNFADTAAAQRLIGAPGQTTAWGAALGTFVDHSGSCGFNYEGGGYAVGVQHAFTERLRAGIGMGQSFGTYESDDAVLKSDQTGIMVGADAQYVRGLKNGKGSYGISGYVAYGNVENDGDTAVGSKAKWDDRIITTGVRADFRTMLSESSSLTLFAGLEYTHGSQEDIDLGSGVSLTDGRMQTWTVPVGMTLRTQIAVQELGTFVPEVTVAYLGNISQQAPTICAGDYKVKGSAPGRSGLMLNAGFNLLIDENWSMGAFYTFEKRSDVNNHAGSFSVRCSF